jgi:membrane protease subunit HflK
MAILVLVAVAIVVWLASGISQIDPNERGVVQRFGRFVAIEQPGLRWHWPRPIETLQKINVTLSVNGSDYKALMLTSDQSLINVGWSVQYRVADPKQYLFDLRDQPTTLRESSETVFRELIARYDLPSLVTGDARGKVTTEARTRIQQALDICQAGIVVTSVNMTDLQLPDAVLAAQRDAAKADEDRRRSIDDAQGTANDIVPKAETSGARQIADAEVYSKQTLAAAEGEAERFSEVAGAYAQAPEVTRNHLYTDTIESILSRSHKIILDTKAGSSIVYLPLDKLAEAMKAAAASGGAAAGTSNGNPSATAAANSSPSSDRSDSDERARERSDR